MNSIDRFLQNYRINMAKKWVREGSVILDIGCGEDAPFLKKIKNKIKNGVGVDPKLKREYSSGNIVLYRGLFPDSIPKINFDAIVMLATLEHMNSEEQKNLSKNCFSRLNQKGILIVTVPSPFVDKILKVLIFFKIAHGMEVEEHYGYEVSKTPEVFEREGFELLKHKKFQIGLNNLFIFRKP